MKWNKFGQNKNGKFLNMTDKLGQMEMIGLVFIVILITLGLLFLSVFSLQDKDEEKIFTAELLAQSTMGALLKTTIDPTANCAEGTLPLQLGPSILEDCASNYNGGNYDFNDCITCKYSCEIEGVPKHSCVFLEHAVTEFLDSTLGTWHKKYDFEARLVTASPLPDTLFSVQGAGGCQNARTVDNSGAFPLPILGLGLVESDLKICN